MFSHGNIKARFSWFRFSFGDPVFGEGKTYNDYGLGFYCTEHIELAKEWACASDKDGYANHYQLDMTGLSVLNLNDLGEAMKLGKLGEQVVLKSRKAFEALTFVDAFEENKEEYYAKYKLRDEEARNRYREIAAQPLAEKETYVIDIIRNNWKNGQGL